jgi:hypothetical protein
MALLNKTPIINARKYTKLFEIPEIIVSQDLSLGGVCLGDNYEGVVAKKIFSYFSLEKSDMKD